MAALIETLISGRDNSEILRDKIAEIIFTEQANQQTLATAASEDPDQWTLRVFTERSNPWDEFQDCDVPGELPSFVAPIVNVWIDNINYDPKRSTTVDRQLAVATFNIDCYGYGVSEELVDGHTPGDSKSALEAQRAARLVRQILMSAHYVQLAESSVVWKRWLQSMQMFQPTIDDRPVARVSAIRLSFVVDFNEFSPQWQGVISEEIAATIQRDESGEISFTVQFGESPP